VPTDTQDRLPVNDARTMASGWAGESSGHLGDRAAGQAGHRDPHSHSSGVSYARMQGVSVRTEGNLGIVLVYE
jgi:hypothetical protein